jgi:enoyl-CoA hydratase/carnithine racemase
VSVRVEWPSALIAEVILDRPEALNAISTELAHQLVKVCEELLIDDRLSVVLVTSSVPKAFCVGADLKERAGFNDHDLRRQRPVMQDAFGSIRNLPVPTLAVVEGYALGGGYELALSCDLIIASETAILGLPEVGLGLIPGGGGTQLLPRRIGWNRAADVIFTGRQIAAEEAYRLGLADRLVASGTARAAALELAGEIAANSPVSLRAAKLALRRGYDVDLPSGLLIENESWEHVAYSADRHEGIAAFIGRRKPRWPGKHAVTDE